MKEKKALSESISLAVQNKLNESGEQPKVVAKAVRKSADKLAKKLAEIFKKINKKKNKAEKKAKKKVDVPATIVGADVPVLFKE